MREIKFRCWDKEERRMLSSRSIEKLLTMEAINKEIIETYIIEQYTGLEDKNGVKIFEGDVIKGDDEGNDFVVYKENKFILEPLGDDCIFWTRCEVIGNIHENPELLNNKP